MKMAFIHNNIVTGPEERSIPAHLSYGQFVFDKLKSGGDRIAQICAETGNSVSYQSILQSSVNLASALQELGLRKGDVVALSSENRFEFTVASLAIIYCGGVLSTLNVTYSPGEITHILSITKPKFIFTSPITAQNIYDCSKDLPYVEKLILFGEYDVVPSVFYNELVKRQTNVDDFTLVDVNGVEDAVAVMCSSGTTGLPKGVMLTHVNFLTLSAHMKYYFETSQQRHKHRVERALSLIPWFHAYGFITTLAIMCMHLQIVFLVRFEEEQYLETIQKYKINMTTLVPPLAVFLAKHPLVPKYDLTSLNEVWCGAAPLSKEIQAAVSERARIGHIRQGYGLTEVTMACCVDLTNGEKQGSCGTPAPGMKIKVLDIETGKKLGPNQEGELWIKSPLRMKGYMGDRAASDALIDSEGYVQTGDVGYYDRDGFFYIVDRLKELIKYKGFQVAPAELEALVLRLGGVAECGVVGRRDELAGELPVAFVVLQPRAQLSATQIQDYVASQVRGQVAPAELEALVLRLGGVAECGVVGRRDELAGELPVAFVVLQPRAQLSATQIQDYVASQVRGQVAPAELEALVLRLGGVAECGVVGRRDELAGELPVAFVVLQPRAQLSATQIQDYVASQVRGQVAPAELEALVLRLGGVAECGVVGRRDELAGELPVAFVVLQPRAQLSATQIQDYVASQVRGQVAPAELEALVLRLGGVAECGVVGRRDELAGELPVAFVVLQPRAQLSATQIQDYVASQVRGQVAPAELEALVLRLGGVAECGVVGRRDELAGELPVAFVVLQPRAQLSATQIQDYVASQVRGQVAPAELEALVLRLGGVAECGVVGRRDELAGELPVAFVVLQPRAQLSATQIQDYVASQVRGQVAPAELEALVLRLGGVAECGVVGRRDELAGELPVAFVVLQPRAQLSATQIQDYVASQVRGQVAPAELEALVLRLGGVAECGVVGRRDELAGELPVAFVVLQPRAQLSATQIQDYVASQVRGQVAPAELEALVLRLGGVAECGVVGRRDELAGELPVAFVVLQPRAQLSATQIQDYVASQVRGQVAPAELEALVLRLGGVAECGVVGRRDELAGELPVAFVVLQPRAQLSATQIQDYVASQVRGQVAPAELEALVLRLGGVAECGVVGRRDELAGELPVAFVVLQPRAQLSATQIQDYVASQVRGQVAPAELEALVLRLGGVAECGVVGRRDELAGELPVAFVVLQPRAQLSATQIQDYVASQVRGQVAPAELEALVLRLGGVAECGVVGRRDELAGELPVAFVVLQPRAQLSATQIQDYVASQVRGQVAPAELEALVLRLGGVAECGVVGRRDELAGELPVAFVVLQPRAQLSATQIQDYVASQVRGQVAPAELEALVLRLGGVAECGVVGRRDELAGELPVAFVVLQPRAQLSATQIQDYVASQVSPAKRLRGGVIFVEEIPKNPSGKILRKELRKLLDANVQSKL